MAAGFPERLSLDMARGGVRQCRRDIARLVCEHPVLREAWASGEGRSAFFCHLNEKVALDKMLPPTASDDAVKALIEVSGCEGGPWMFQLLFSALAVALGCDIVSVSRQSILYYPRSLGWYRMEGARLEGRWASTAEGIQFVDLSDPRGAFPPSAFNPATVVIRFNQLDHFAATRRVPKYDAQVAMSDVLVTLGPTRLRNFILSEQRPAA